MVREWAFSICAAGVAAAVVRMIIPHMRLKGAAEAVLSLLILIAVMSPVLSLSGRGDSFEAPRVNNGEINAQAQNFAAQAVRFSIESEVDNIMRQMGIKADGVRINIEVTGSSYNVASVEIYLGQEWESRHDELIALLRKELGQAVYVSYCEEDAR